jgi:hypothetical protein
MRGGRKNLLRGGSDGGGFLRFLLCFQFEHGERVQPVLYLTLQIARDEKRRRLARLALRIFAHGAVGDGQLLAAREFFDAVIVAVILAHVRVNVGHDLHLLCGDCGVIQHFIFSSVFFRF